ncbi:hypothetical protein BJ165DRAFT_1462600 [Panaeolus papilionaceus]|nr:hypothetical protein BJ165DRAFT_1462600 [Panaeolus papilionaceus]
MGSISSPVRDVGSLARKTGSISSPVRVGSLARKTGSISSPVRDVGSLARKTGSISSNFRAATFPVSGFINASECVSWYTSSTRLTRNWRCNSAKNKEAKCEEESTGVHDICGTVITKD